MPVDQAVFIRRVVVAAEHKITQRVSNLLALVGLNLLHHMRMVADDQIRALVNAVAPNRLLRGVAVVGALDPPVVVEHHQIRAARPQGLHGVFDKPLLRAVKRPADVGGEADADPLDGHDRHALVSGNRHIRGQIAHSIVKTALQIVHGVVVCDRDHVDAARFQHLGVFRPPLEHEGLVGVRSRVCQRTLKIHHGQVVIKKLRDAGKEIRGALLVIHLVKRAAVCEIMPAAQRAVAAEGERQRHAVISRRISPARSHFGHLQRGLHPPERQDGLLNGIAALRGEFPVCPAHDGLSALVGAPGYVFDRFDRPARDRVIVGKPLRLPVGLGHTEYAHAPLHHRRCLCAGDQIVRPEQAVCPVDNAKLCRRLDVHAARVRKAAGGNIRQAAVQRVAIRRVLRFRLRRRFCLRLISRCKPAFLLSRAFGIVWPAAHLLLLVRHFFRCLRFSRLFSHYFLYSAGFFIFFSHSFLIFPCFFGRIPHRLVRGLRSGFRHTVLLCLGCERRHLQLDAQLPRQFSQSGLLLPNDQIHSHPRQLGAGHGPGIIRTQIKRFGHSAVLIRRCYPGLCPAADRDPLAVPCRRLRPGYHCRQQDGRPDLFFHLSLPPEILILPRYSIPGVFASGFMKNSPVSAHPQLNCPPLSERMQANRHKKSCIRSRMQDRNGFYLYGLSALR